MYPRKMRLAYRTWRSSVVLGLKIWCAFLEIEERTVRRHWKTWRRAFHTEQSVRARTEISQKKILHSILVHWRSILADGIARKRRLQKLEDVFHRTLLTSTFQCWQEELTRVKRGRAFLAGKEEKLLERAIEVWHQRTQDWIKRHRLKEYAAELFRTHVEKIAVGLMRAAMHARQHARREKAKLLQWERLESIVLFFRAWKSLTVNTARKAPSRGERITSEIGIRLLEIR